MATNLLFALGLGALGLAQGPIGLFSAWALIGVAMGSGLHEAAVATLVRLCGHASRNPIIGNTLMAGFASTVGWPLSTLPEVQFGGRGACFAWAALHLLLGLPLNAMLPQVMGHWTPCAAHGPCLRRGGEQTRPVSPCSLIEVKPAGGGRSTVR